MLDVETVAGGRERLDSGCCMSGTDAQPLTLLERIARGDTGAVREVLDTYGGLVYSLARRFFRTEQEAEDAAQEIFLDVWRSAGRYDRTLGAEVTFVATIARRRLIDRARRSGREGARATLAAEPEQVGERPEPSVTIEARDEIRRARTALEALSAEQQRVLRLSIYQGLSHERIAESTGLPLGTVKTHARRGLMRLRELLGVGSGNEPVRDVRAMGGRAT